MENKQFCQSCAMPLSEGTYGRNADGSDNHDYCAYCFVNGEFTMPQATMDEMIEFCVKPMAENNPGMSEDEARAQMKQFFPSLKRWKNQ